MHYISNNHIHMPYQMGRTEDFIQITYVYPKSEHIFMISVVNEILESSILEAIFVLMIFLKYGDMFEKLLTTSYNTVL